MISRGDVISYLEMCTEEGTNLQRGINFLLREDYSVPLMSLRPNAPFADRIEEDDTVLIYEGHDVSARRGGPDPKTVDQPMYNPGGSLTQNGLFYEAAMDHRNGFDPPERVKVYEKLFRGICVYNGIFDSSTLGRSGLVIAEFSSSSRSLLKTLLSIMSARSTTLVAIA
jgi:hypothetical protein